MDISKQQDKKEFEETLKEYKKLLRTKQFIEEEIANLKQKNFGMLLKTVKNEVSNS